MSMKPNTIYMSYHFLTLLNSKRKIFRSLAILLMILGLFLFSTNSAYSQSTLKKIVIDAGHGGKDPGASGKYSREKDVVLAIALKTGQLLKKKYPELEIIYTRKTDIFIPLKERAHIANKNKADLFISIHCNSNASSQPHGSETYVMGLHKSEANLNVAKKENSAMLFEDDYEQTYDGFDPTTDESHIIFNFFQNSFLSQNLDLASTIQDKFTSNTNLRNRGVKQAGFWVLYKTTMPGVLIETGFLSNAKDEKLLNSKAGQLKLSEAITKAIEEYKDKYDALEKTKQAHKKPNGKVEQNPIVKNEPKTVIKEEPKTITKEKAKENSKPIAEEKTNPATGTTTQLPIFKVQFLSLSTKKELKGKKYDQLPKISSYKYKGLFRYTSGETQDYETAIKLQSQVRKAGFTDAFIIAFYKGKRISLKKAKELIN